MSPGDDMTLIESHPDGVTVDDVNEVRYHDRDNTAKIRRIVAVEPLADGLKQTLNKRLQK